MTPILGLWRLTRSHTNQDCKPISSINVAENAVQTEMNSCSLDQLRILASIKETKTAASPHPMFSIKLNWSMQADRCELECSELSTDANACTDCLALRPGTKEMSYEIFGYCWK